MKTLHSVRTVSAKLLVIFLAFVLVFASAPPLDASAAEPSLRYTIRVGSIKTVDNNIFITMTEGAQSCKFRFTQTLVRTTGYIYGVSTSGILLGKNLDKFSVTLRTGNTDTVYSVYVLAYGTEAVSSPDSLPTLRYSTRVARFEYGTDTIKVFTSVGSKTCKFTYYSPVESTTGIISDGFFNACPGDEFTVTLDVFGTDKTYTVYILSNDGSTPKIVPAVSYTLRTYRADISMVKDDNVITVIMAKDATSCKLKFADTIVSTTGTQSSGLFIANDGDKFEVVFLIRGKSYTWTVNVMSYRIVYKPTTSYLLRVQSVVTDGNNINVLMTQNASSCKFKFAETLVWTTGTQSDGMITASPNSVINVTLSCYGGTEEITYTVNIIAPEPILDGEFVTVGERVYYYVDGVPVTRLHTVGIKSCCFGPTGIYYGDYVSTYTGLFYDGLNIYYYKNGAVYTGENFWYTLYNDSYYIRKTGKAQKGLYKVNDAYRWFADNGVMESGIINTGSGYMYFDKDGKMETGLIEYNGDLYDFTENGYMVYGFATINGNMYYFGTDGKALRNTVQEINGVTYRFDSDCTGYTCASDDFTHLAIGDTASETAHSLILSGAQKETLTVTAGKITKTYTAAVMDSTSDRISYTLKFDAGNSADVTIEINEIHKSTDSPIAYYIYAGATKLYYRTYEPASDCENHYFVTVPASLFGSSSSIDVTLVPDCDSVIRISDFYNYYNLASIAGEENYQTEMSVGYLSSAVTKSEIQSTFSSSQAYNGCYSEEFAYMHMTAENAESNMKNLIDSAVAANTPVAIGLNSWWGGTTNDTFDGCGGTFADLQYQQVMYDPLNADGRGYWKLTVPNMWSNTAWLTMSSSVYNAARESRVQHICSFIANYSAQLKSEGKNLTLYLYTENEPTYWAWPSNTYTDLNNTTALSTKSPNATADFSQNVIDAAAVDGVNLNPQDGISSSEARWMFTELSNYMSDLGDAYSAGLGYDAIVIKDGEVFRPDSQQLKNSYTHCPVECDWFPNTTANIQGYERHFLDTLNFGFETCYVGDEREFDYSITGGITANINAERAAMNDASLKNAVKQSYANGLSLFNIYNAAHTDLAIVSSTESELSSQVSVKNYPHNFCVTDFTASSSLGDASLNIESSKNVELINSQYGNLLCPSDISSTGNCYVTFKVPNTSGPDGLIYVKLEGENYYAQGYTSYTIAVSKNTTRFTTKYNNVQLGEYSLDVSSYTGSYVYVRVYINSTVSTINGSKDWVNLKRVSFRKNGSDASGQIYGSNQTYKQKRLTSTIVGRRGDTDELLEKYEALCGRDSSYNLVVALMDQGRYSSAYSAISAKISEVLPAKYSVTGSGLLGKYPVSVSVNGTIPANITLKSISKTGASFELTGMSADMGVTVTLTDVEDGSYTLTETSYNNYTIEKTVSGTVSSGGTIAFTINANSSTDKELVSHFEGMAAATGNQFKLCVKTHDKTMNDFAPYIEVPASTLSGMTAYFGNYGEYRVNYTVGSAKNIAYGDKLEMYLDSTGITTVYVTRAQTFSGTVTAIEESSVNGLTGTKNPYITVQNAQGKSMRFEIGGNCSLEYSSAASSALILNVVGHLGLNVGNTVSVRFTPYTVSGQTALRALSITN